MAPDDSGCFPDAPVKPLPSDCCGNGCKPCVMDVYEEEMQRWQMLCGMTAEQRAEWRREKATASLSQLLHPRPALSQGSYRRFQVVSKDILTRNVYKFTFELLPDEWLGLAAGQHAMLRLWDREEGLPVVRPYTPVSPLHQSGSFDVIIKIYDGGKMSRLVKELNVGNSGEWRGPLGNFNYVPNTRSQIVMLACGTGIAPMLQVASIIVENENDETYVHMVYCCRTQHDILMKHKLNELASFWNFTVVYVLSSCTKDQLLKDPGLTQYGDKVIFGRIGENDIIKEVSSPSPKKMVLICGTKSFEEDMARYLTRMSYDTSMYFTF